MRRAIPIVLVALLSAPALARAQVMEGSWEGEFRTDRSPVFMTLHLEEVGGVWRGSVDLLGRSIPLAEVSVADEAVRAVVVPGANGLHVEATLSGDRLVGAVVERDLRYPMELVPVPDYPEPADRAEAWHQDLDALAGRFLRADRSFSEEERAEFRERIDELRARVDELHDDEIVMRMATAVALSGNAHTRLYLLRNRTELRRLPIRVWWFDDQLRVVRATPARRDLLGCRVDAIGGVPAREARERVSAAFAGNASWTDYKSVYYLTSPEALHGFGIVADPDGVELTLSACRDEPFTARLEPLPLVRSDEPVEAWWDLSPRHEGDDWVHALEDAGEPPLYLRHPDRHYWFELLPDSGVLYFQYNRASEMDGETTAEFGGRLLGALDSLEPRAFVLDLRFNTGGSLGLARDLMSELGERTRGIPRFVITGRATFSAGLTHVVGWKAAGDVTIVGEPVGDELDYWSEGGNITLPNSGFDAHFANAFHGYSETPCPEEVPCFLDLSVPDVEPDVPVGTTWEAYAAGQDPAMEAIEGILRGDPR